ncbi:MAG: Hint domain-containing protein [Pseudomonadota bacterium]
MAETILGDGFTVNTATYSGDNNSSGVYTGAASSNPGVLPSDTGVLFSTGLTSNFANAGGGNNSGSTSTNTAGGVDGDADFNTAAGGATFDASFLEINFTPDSGVTQLNLEFRFYSEEYREYVYSNFNDVALVMLDGTPVPISAGDGTISVNSINDAATYNPANGSEALDPNPGNGQFDSASPNLYIDNGDGSSDTEFDGFTVTLSLDINVTPGQSYDLKLGIADKGDSVWDSAFAIAANTGTVNEDPTALDDSVQVARGFSTNADLLNNDSDPDNPATLVITQINGVNVTAGSQVQLATGQIIQLNANGTITVIGNSGDLGVTQFAYTIADADGNTDSAFVTLTTVPPCFTPGTLITTPHGPRDVADLKAGDVVVTRDNGLQTIRWVGERAISGAAMFASNSKLAPIRIPRGAFGAGLPMRDLYVSPLHHILVHGATLSLTTGHSEAILPARDLIGTRNIIQDTTVRTPHYIHLLFDRHEVIYAHGLATESLMPGKVALEGFSLASREAFFTIRPDLRSDPSQFGPTARYVLKRTEYKQAFALA